MILGTVGGLTAAALGICAGLLLAKRSPEQQYAALARRLRHPWRGRLRRMFL